MKSVVKLGLLATCLFLASCAQFKLVNTSPLDVKGFNVTPSTAWALSPFKPGKKAELWTIDGYGLNQMLVFGEIKEGETLFNESSKELPMPKFRADMLPNELEDLIKTSISNQEGGQLKIVSKNVRPQDINGQIGFRFELEFFNGNGLQKNSDVIVWVKENQLYGMMFTAPTLHYYENFKAEVDATYRSIQA